MLSALLFLPKTRYGIGICNLKSVDFYGDMKYNQMSKLTYVPNV